MNKMPKYCNPQIWWRFPVHFCITVLSLSGCHREIRKDLQISIPDTIFADSCRKNTCFYTLYPKVTEKTNPTKIEYLYVRENCVNCNFELSSKCQAKIMDDSLYWFKLSQGGFEYG